MYYHFKSKTWKRDDRVPTPSFPSTSATSSSVNAGADSSGFISPPPKYPPGFDDLFTTLPSGAESGGLFDPNQLDAATSDNAHGMPSLHTDWLKPTNNGRWRTS
jgi:hypothetical protein